MDSRESSNSAYWVERLSGLRTLSTGTGFGDSAKPGSRTLARCWLPLSPAASHNLARLSECSEARQLAWFAAAVGLVLRTYSGRPDHSVGTRSPKSDRLVLVGIRLGDDPPLGEAVRRIESELAEVGDLHVESLTEIRAGLATSAPDSTVNVAVVVHRPGVRAAPLSDFVLQFVLQTAAPPALTEPRQIEALYDPDCFDAAIIQRCLANLMHVCESLAEHQDQTINDFEVLCEAELRDLAGFNDTRSEYPRNETIHELFGRSVRRLPDKPALISRGVELSYRELDARANPLAIRLRSHGVGKDRIVAVMSGRTPLTVVGILAVLKAGGCYMMINPDDPAKRRQQLLRDSDPLAVLIPRHLAADPVMVGWAPEGVFYLDDEVEAASSDLHPPHGSATDLAYVMYTSGTSGKPKGVMVEHRSVVRLVANTNYIDFGAEDRILQVGALEFDAATFEIWGALLNGLTLCLADAEDALTPAGLLHLINDWRITTLWLTSSLFTRLAEADSTIFADLRHLLVGGDRLSPWHVNAVRRKSPRLRITNGYGPTENTTFSTTFAVDREYQDAIPIGKPIANSTAYVLDARRRPAPIGVVGELYVGGDGVARGYLNDPELTASRFVTDAGQRLFRTGDLARWMPDGNLEFWGRCDDQLKIRGYRIEPAEIEARLVEHPDVAEAAVLGIAQDGAERRLCAFVVSGCPLTSGGMREYLAERLPDYMIPARFVFLKQMPLTAHGKVDRRALAEHCARASEQHLPASPASIAERVTAIWNELLECRAESTEDNFFDAGGHSMLAISLLSRIKSEFRVEVTLRQFLKSPTLATLQQLVERNEVTATVRIERQPKQPWYELSVSQERLVRLCEENPDSAAFNIQSNRIWRQAVIPEFVQRALNALVQRHDSLRTRFARREGCYVQIVEPECSLQLQEINLEPLNGQARDDEANRLRSREGTLSIPLDQAPLCRATLIRHSADEFELLFTTHHIICDGWSLDVLNREFEQLYADFAAGRRSSLPPVPLQFTDYIAWQNQFLADPVRSRKAVDFWSSYLAGPLKPTWPPHDFPGSSGSVDRSSSGYRLVVSDHTTRRLREVARRNETSLFMVLFASFLRWLHDLTGREDLITGIPSANRQYENLAHTVGFLVDSVLVRTTVDKDKSFVDFLQHVTDNTLRALEFASYPIELACQTVNTTWPEILATFFNMSTFGDVNRRVLNDRHWRHLEHVQESKLEFVLYLTEHADGVDISVHYFNKLYHPSSVERHMRMYVNALDVLADEQVEGEC